ncbi:hypothetical protein ACLOJK_010393 [Asimina triloba]
MDVGKFAQELKTREKIKHLLKRFRNEQYKFGMRSCFHRVTEDIVIKIAISVLVQLLIGYVILPLYGLVTQMGSTMNKVVFTDRVSHGLKNWHVIAKRKLGTNPMIASAPSLLLPAAQTHEIKVKDVEHPLAVDAVEIAEVERATSSSSSNPIQGRDLSFSFRF